MRVFSISVERSSMLSATFSYTSFFALNEDAAKIQIVVIYLTD
jgi:hypothetical protein